MTEFYAAEKKLNFADFLISRSGGESYAHAAFSHTLTAATIILKELTDLDEVSLRSPQMVAKALKKFNEPKAAEFSKFYTNLLKLTGKSQIPLGDVEDAIRQAKKFMDWVKEHKIN